MALGSAGLASALTRNHVGAIELTLVAAGLLGFGLWGMRRGGSASPRNALNAAAAAGYAFFFFLCLGFVYLLVQPRLPEVDLTSVRLNTLSGVSKNWLRQLQQEVRLTAFLTDRDQIESFRADVERIRELAPSVSYEILDPLNDSTRALEFLQGKGDSVFPGDIFVQSGERRRRLRMFKRLSEGDLLNAMVATTLTGPSTVYFLGGHGEFEIVEDKQKPASAARTVGVLRTLLEQRGYAVRTLSLGASSEGVPQDALCVVAMGSERPLSESEIAILRQYLFERGGRVIAAFGTGDLGFAGSRLPGWGTLAKEFGVEMRDEAIIDLEGKRRYGSEFVAAPTFGPARKPILPNDPVFQGVYFERARAMDILKPAPRRNRRPRVSF